MKKLFIVSLISVLCSFNLDGNAGAISAPASGSVPWWLQPTICKPNTSSCYSNMGAGFDTGMWDATSSCWGLKMICPEATTTSADTEPVAMGKATIANGTGIDSDFDTSILNGNCFGTRKTTNNGSQVLIDGDFVNVWCSGVLDNPSEIVPNGEIQTGSQPTCKTLAQDGWVAVLNQRCYGKYFDPDKYYIECEGTNLLPKRIIVLNGSEKIIGSGSAPSANYPIDTSAATTLFDKMQGISAAKKSQHF